MFVLWLIAKFPLTSVQKLVHDESIRITNYHKRGTIALYKHSFLACSLYCRFPASTTIRLLWSEQVGYCYPVTKVGEDG